MANPYLEYIFINIRMNRWPLQEGKNPPNRVNDTTWVGGLLEAQCRVGSSRLVSTAGRVDTWSESWFSLEGWAALPLGPCVASITATIASLFICPLHPLSRGC